MLRHSISFLKDLVTTIKPGVFGTYGLAKVQTETAVIKHCKNFSNKTSISRIFFMLENNSKYKIFLLF